MFNSIMFRIGTLIIGSRDPMIGEDNQDFHLLNNYMSMLLQHVYRYVHCAVITKVNSYRITLTVLSFGADSKYLYMYSVLKKRKNSINIVGSFMCFVIMIPQFSWQRKNSMLLIFVYTFYTFIAFTNLVFSSFNDIL